MDKIKWCLKAKNVQPFTQIKVYTKGEYFFYGLITSFNILNKKEFVKNILNGIKIEEKVRKERKKNEIEWEIIK